MVREIRSIPLGAGTVGDHIDAVLPTRVLRYASPRFRLGPVPPDRDGQEPANDGGLARSYVVAGETVGTLLTIPVAIGALALSAVLAAAAAALLVATVVVAGVGAAIGAVVGAARGALGHDTSARRGATAGIGVAAIGVGLLGSIGLATVGTVAAFGLSAVSHVIETVAEAAGYRIWAVSNGSAALARSARQRLATRAARLRTRGQEAAPVITGQAPAPLTGPETAPTPETAPSRPAQIVPRQTAGLAAAVPAAPTAVRPAGRPGVPDRALDL